MYVPYYENSQCAYLYNDNFIRVYDSVPLNNSTIGYTDYLLNHHYLSRRGTTTFSQYSSLPVCSDNVTTNFYYRVDIYEILVIFFLFIFINYFMLSKLYRALFRGRALK